LQHQPQQRRAGTSGAHDEREGRPFGHRAECSSAACPNALPPLLVSRRVAHRVLYVVDSLGLGGAERGLVLTLGHLDSERVRPEVAMLWDPDTLAPEISALGVPLHR